MKRVLSGIRATGRLHFGSLLGAVQNFVRFQNDPDNECLYFIADYHTLTTLDDPELLRSNLVEIVKDYLAAGLNPESAVIYAQSSVPALAELSLFLSMAQPLGDLQRIPTFKDLVRNDPDNASLGLITYPVLMAADILGPKSDIVPVGQDQKPNVELARSLARRFNDRYGDIFVIPETMEHMVLVPGLDGGKMGKSNSQNAIEISMSKEEISDRYKKRGVTDTKRVSRSTPGDPYNRCKSVYPLHELVTPGEVETRIIANRCLNAEIGCAECKAHLVDGIFDILGPFQDKRAEFSDKDDLVREILHEGGKRARAIINPTVEEVAHKMGITRFVK